LSLEERKQIVKNKYFREFYWKIVDDDNDMSTIFEMNKRNIPTRAISLMWNQRSVDTFLGLPFNIASYGLLLEIIAEIVNMVPDELIGNLGDVHLYSNHIEQAKEQIGRDYTYTERWNILKDKYGSALGLNHDRIEEEVNETTPARTREPFPLPKIIINGEFWNPGTPDGCGMGAGTYTDDIDSLIKGFELSDFQLENYQSHPAIKAPLSN
jgi:thymidylate synthase